MAFLGFLCDTLFKYLHISRLVQLGEELLFGNGLTVFFFFLSEKINSLKEETKLS